MKKFTFIILTALLGLAFAAPVLANENATAEVKANKPAAVYAPRVVTVRGTITAVSSKVLPTDITVTVEKITPKSIKNYLGTYPVANSSVVVHVTTDTKLIRKYLGKADFTEIAVGDKVDVTGKLQADGSVNATMVRDQSIHVTFNAQKGTVLTVDVVGKIFTVKNENKEFKVYVTDATKFAKAGVTSPTLADLKVGDAVNVRGVIRQAVGEVNADYVLIKVGENERQLKQLELKKQVLEKALAKVQAELAAVLKRIEELKGAVITPAVTQ